MLCSRQGCTFTLSAVFVWMAGLEEDLRVWGLVVGSLGARAGTSASAEDGRSGREGHTRSEKDCFIGLFLSWMVKLATAVDRSNNVSQNSDKKSKKWCFCCVHHNSNKHSHHTNTCWCSIHTLFFSRNSITATTQKNAGTERTAQCPRGPQAEPTEAPKPTILWCVVCVCLSDT